MDCKECESLLKEVDLLQALLKVEEGKVKQLREVLDRLRELEDE